MDINRVTLKGNICSDIEIKNGGTDKAYMNIRVATNQGVKKADSSGWDNVPTFHNVTVFKKMAEYLESEAKKGDGVYIEGTIRYSEKDGKYYTNILANDVFLTRSRQKKDSQSTESAQQPDMPQTRATLEEVKDDLPF